MLVCNSVKEDAVLTTRLTLSHQEETSILLLKLFRIKKNLPKEP